MARLGIESTLGMRDVENNPRDYGIAQDKARDKKNRPFFFQKHGRKLKSNLFLISYPTLAILTSDGVGQSTSPTLPPPPPSFPPSSSLLPPPPPSSSHFHLKKEERKLNPARARRACGNSVYIYLYFR